jgi:hypothetical protein
VIVIERRDGGRASSAATDDGWALPAAESRTMAGHEEIAVAAGEGDQPVAVG